MAFKLELTEAQFEAQVEQLASHYGWAWIHIAPAMNDRGYWRTPIRGDLGRGWPDLMLVKGSRVIFAELKANGKYATSEQKGVLALLSHIPGAEVYVWHPHQWEEIAARLSS